MEYKVVPFVASIDPEKGTSDHVAEQLERLIILIKVGICTIRRSFNRLKQIL